MLAEPRRKQCEAQEKRREAEHARRDNINKRRTSSERGKTSHTFGHRFSRNRKRLHHPIISLPSQRVRVLFALQSRLPLLGRGLYCFADRFCRYRLRAFGPRGDL